MTVLKKILQIVGLIIGIDILIVFGFAAYPHKVHPADAIIVLGAGVNTPSLEARTLKGVDLYLHNDAQVLVLAGGQGPVEPRSEAAAMKKIVDKNHPGVPVVLEDKSQNTLQNIQFSKKLIPNASTIVLVSDQYHLARAYFVAKRNGFKHVYLASPAQGYYQNKSELAFYYIRELAAMIKYVPTFILNK